MARGINKVILVGNLGKDPETRYMPNGKAVTNFSIATSESWKDKQTGEQREQTEWHNIVMYDRLAEIAAEYLKKGSQVYVEGKLRTQVAGQGRPRPLHHRDQCQRDADAWRPRGWRWWRHGRRRVPRGRPSGACQHWRWWSRTGAGPGRIAVRRRYPVLGVAARKGCASHGPAAEAADLPGPRAFCAW